MKSPQSSLSKVEMDKLICPVPALPSREVLRENPDLSFLSHLNYAEEKYRPAINTEINKRWLKLNGGKHRHPVTNEGGYRKITQQIEQEYIDQHCVQRARTLLWLLSERTLNILRTKGLIPSPTSESTEQAMLRFIQRLDTANFPEIDETKPQLGPNEYLETARPKLVADWGYPFYSTVIEQIRTTPGWGQQDAKRVEERIIGLNADFWAAFLGGDHRLGHDVVFYQPEQRFYFVDIVAGCYVPTSEEKMRLWLSQAIQQRAWGQAADVATTLLATFRAKKVVDEILAKAGAILAVEAGFFNGPDARPRWGGTHMTPNVQVVVDTFVKERVEQAHDGIMPLGEILLQLGRTPQLSVDRKELTQKVNDSIRSTFNRGLRNDLRLEDNRVVSGWKGVRLRVTNAPNTEIQNSGTSVESEVELIEQTKELGLRN